MMKHQLLKLIEEYVKGTKGKKVPSFVLVAVLDQSSLIKVAG